MRYNNTNKKYTLLLLLIVCSCILTNCNDGEDANAPDYPAKVYARSVGQEIYSQYLQCYPLDPQAKEKCADRIAKQYLPKRKRKNIPYKEFFEIEAEKLAFKKFIIDHDLPCRKINESPELVKEKQAYLIKCVNTRGYWMQFDYETKEWKLVK